MALAFLTQTFTFGTFMGSSRRIIDSHLHVWSDGKQPFPWEVEPPEALKVTATVEKLLHAAKEAGVSGALIVQPANHKYDHSYVTRALRQHPQFFRGMCSEHLFEHPILLLSEELTLPTIVLGALQIRLCHQMKPCILSNSCMQTAMSECVSIHTYSRMAWTQR